MHNLIFSLNATMPVFLMMLLGLFFHKIGWMSDEFASNMNTFVFRVSLPVLLFSQLSSVDFADVWDMKFVIFCFMATLLCIAIAFFIAHFLKDGSLKGEMVQASYRSSAALLGIAYIQNIYGKATMASLMIIGAVPLYNIMAVVVLTITAPGNSSLDKTLMKKTLKGVITNPIIIGIIIGFVWSLLRIPIPVILKKTVDNIGSTSTPLGLMAMGASFDIKKAFGKAKPALFAAFMKLIGWAAIFLPIAVAMGFRKEKLIAILIMLGSATTVSSYVMARNMHHEGILTSSVVMLTTMLCAFTLTFWIFVLKSLGLL